MALNLTTLRRMAQIAVDDHESGGWSAAEELRAFLLANMGDVAPLLVLSEDEARATIESWTLADVPPKFLGMMRDGGKRRREDNARGKASALTAALGRLVTSMHYDEARACWTLDPSALADVAANVGTHSIAFMLPGDEQIVCSVRLVRDAIAMATRRGEVTAVLDRGSYGVRIRQAEWRSGTVERTREVSRKVNGRRVWATETYLAPATVRGRPWTVGPNGDLRPHETLMVPCVPFNEPAAVASVDAAAE
jgi:hypothetical protein